MSASMITLIWSVNLIGSLAVLGILVLAQTKSASRKRNYGKSLAVSAAVAALASLALLVSSLYYGNTNQMQFQLKETAAALKNFRRVYGRYPTSEEGLRVLTRVPTLVPVDHVVDMDPFTPKFINPTRDVLYSSSDGKSYVLSAPSDHFSIRGDEKGQWTPNWNEGAIGH